MRLALVRKQVTEMLALDERCRNDDRYLYVRVLERFYDVDPTTSLWAWVTKDCPGFESVRRSRNLIQSSGLYPPTDSHVAQVRGRSMETGKHAENEGAEAEVREELGYAVPTGEHLFGGDVAEGEGH